MTPVRDTARTLTERGYVVHALVDGQKYPRRKHWQKATESDPAALDGNAAGIGIVTGNGLLVIDSDCKPEAGIDGESALHDLYAKHGQTPPEPTALTGGGGCHRWYRVDGKTPRNTASKIGAGIDSRGDGGQVVVPPSPHASGNHYAWLHGPPPPLAELPEAPAWLLTALTADKTAAPQPARTQSTPAAQSTFDAVGTVGEGKRNDSLTSAVGAWLRRQPTLPEREEAVTYGRQWNREHCEPPLDSVEVLGTARSIWSKERERRATEGDGEFAQPPKMDVETVFGKVFDSILSADVTAWERIVSTPRPPTYRLRTSEGDVSLTTLSRFPTARDAFSLVGLLVSPAYSRAAAWRTAAAWPAQVAERVDNEDDDADGVAEWILGMVRDCAPWQRPQVDVTAGLVAVSSHSLTAYVDSVLRGQRLTDAAIRLRLRDAGFTRIDGYWQARAAYVVSDANLARMVTAALTEHSERSNAHDARRGRTA